MITNEIELLQFLNECLSNNQYKKGLETLNKYEHLVEKKYYEITKIKILFLLFLNEIIEASSLINEELKVPYIPRDFEDFLIEKQREVELVIQESNKKIISMEDLLNIDKFDEAKLIEVIPSLNDFNLNKLVDKIQVVFDNPKISNLIKSLLIASLSDNGLNATFSVIKENTTIRFNPSTILDIRETDNFYYIRNEIKKLADIEINCMELITRLVITYLLDIYPLVITDEYCDEILVSAIYLCNEMMGTSIKNANFDDFIENRSQKIEKICKKINILLETI